MQRKRPFSVDPKRVRDCQKNKTELQRLSEEDSKRARLGTSEELEIIMWEQVITKWARHERVFRKIIRVMAKEMYTTVSAKMRSFP